MNVGDYLALLSAAEGGAYQYRSPIHRVMHGEEERTSFVFFHYPSASAPTFRSCGARRAGDDVGDFNTLCRGGGAEEAETFGAWLEAKWAGVRAA